LSTGKDIRAFQPRNAPSGTGSDKTGRTWEVGLDLEIGYDRRGEKTMSTRRWILVIAALALILAVVMRLIAPIVWDRQGRAKDDLWLKAQSGDEGVK
jgi:hypothetical protein